jgi:hypothetical protein
MGPLRIRCGVVLVLFFLLTLLAVEALASDGPSVTIESPKDGSVVSTTTVNLRGTATSGSRDHMTVQGHANLTKGVFNSTGLDGDDVILAGGGMPGKFGGCAEAQRAKDYINYPQGDFAWGTEATFEFWIKYDAKPNDDTTVFQGWRSAGGSRLGLTQMFFERNPDVLTMSYLPTDTETWQFISMTMPSTDTWHHISASYGNDGLTLSIDGQISIGPRKALGRAYGNVCLGHRTTRVVKDCALVMIDDFRVSTGQRYTANFVPPTAALTVDATTVFLDALDGSTVGTNSGWKLSSLSNEGDYVSEVYDSGIRLPELYNVSYSAQVPGGTNLTLFLRSSPSEDMLNATDWTEVVQGDLGGLVAGRYLQFMVAMGGSSSSSPRFNGFSMEIGGLRSVLVSLDGETWIAAEDPRQWSVQLEVEEGIVTALVLATDIAGKIKVTYTTFIVIVTPPTGHVVLAGGEEYVNDPKVPVEIVMGEDTYIASMLISTVAGFPYSEWVPYHRTTTIDFGFAEGMVTVYIKVRDVAGHESTTMRDSVILDTTPPKGELAIGDGSGITLQSTIDLFLNMTDDSGIVSMRIGKTSDLSAVPWSPFLEVLNWDLADEEGLHTIHAQVVDPAGNTLQVLAQVILDLRAPTVDVRLGDGSAIITYPTVDVHVTASDANGVTQIRRATSLEELTDAPWEPYGSSYTLSLGDVDIAWTEWVEVMDAVGRTAKASASVLLDATPPEGSLVISGGAEFVHSLDVELAIDVADDGSGVAFIRVADSESFTGAPNLDPVSTMDWRFSEGEGTRTVWLQVVDLAGHKTVVKDTVIVATLPPQGLVSVVTGLVATRDITVSLTVDDAEEVLLSEDPEALGPWQAINGTMAFTLSPGDGTKTVHAWFRNKYDLVSQMSQATVVLDTTAPSVNITTPMPNQVLKVLTVTFAGSAYDENGLALIEARVGDGPWEPVPVSGSWSTSMTLADWGKDSLHVRVTDAVGNQAEAELALRTEEKVDVKTTSALTWLLILVIVALAVVVGMLLFRPRITSPPDHGSGV